MNKMDTWLEVWVLEEKGLEGGKTKTTWDGWNKHRWKELENWSCYCWNDRIYLKRDTLVEKKLKWKTRWSRRISIHIEIWEHRLEKVWNQHLTSKQLEYHNWKQKERIGLQNKPEQTYDRDFVRTFCGGAYTGSIVQHHHVQGSAHDIWSVPESALAKDSLRHNETIVKPTVDRRTTRRRTPISYHTSVGKIS